MRTCSSHSGVGTHQHQERREIEKNKEVKRGKKKRIEASGVDGTLKPIKQDVSKKDK